MTSPLRQLYVGAILIPVYEYNYKGVFRHITVTYTVK